MRCRLHANVSQQPFSVTNCKLQLDLSRNHSYDSNHSKNQSYLLLILLINTWKLLQKFGLEGNWDWHRKLRIMLCIGDTVFVMENFHSISWVSFFNLPLMMPVCPFLEYNTTMNNKGLKY